MVRMRDPDAERGPGLFFILVALVVVAVLGARYLGFYPANFKPTLGGGGQKGAATPAGEVKEGGPLVAIYHSHTTECYAPGDSHTAGEPGEIVQVGRALKEALALRGVPAIHSETIHDYPVFKEAYRQSQATVAQQVQEHPSLQMVFDLHRDGLPPDAPLDTASVEINGQRVARILLVVGDQGAYQEENLRFAEALDARLNEMYPGLSRGVKVVSGGFNGGVFPQAVGVFIGSYPQNTLEEAERAAKLFADVAATLIKEPEPGQ